VYRDAALVVFPGAKNFPPQDCPQAFGRISQQVQRPMFARVELRLVGVVVHVPVVPARFFNSFGQSRHPAHGKPSLLAEA